jgi:hypothetical protein
MKKLLLSLSVIGLLISCGESEEVYTCTYCGGGYTLTYPDLVDEYGQKIIGYKAICHDHTWILPNSKPEITIYDSADPDNHCCSAKCAKESVSPCGN